MELVIKIDDDEYKRWRESGEIDALAVRDALVKAKPLPKGHGRLKDVDRIKTAFPCGEYVRTESVRATIDHEDTIIEADKEGAEK